MKKKLIRILSVSAIMLLFIACTSSVEPKKENAGESSGVKASSGTAASEDLSSGTAASEDPSSEAQDSEDPAEEDASEENILQDNTDEDVLSFETADLDGNVILSEDLFKENRLTMINLWGTYCGPCINEMPGLEELNERLKEKECAIVGLVIDVEGPEDKALLDEAKDILADTGVSYLNLFPWDGWYRDLPAQFIPTSYFVDREGHIVGKAAVGARAADEYEKLIDALLESE